eukprot:1561797-Amphidinium_carterae.1
MAVSIISVATRDMAAQLVKWSRDHPMHMVSENGDLEERKVTLRPQIAEFDRLCTLPVKAAMRALTEADPSMGSHFSPIWKEAKVLLENRECITWKVNVETAIITLSVQPAHRDYLQRTITQHIYAFLQGSPAKGTKGNGKGKYKSKLGHAADDACFDSFQGPLKDMLADLSVGCFPLKLWSPTLQCQTTIWARTWNSKCSHLYLDYRNRYRNGNSTKHKHQHKWHRIVNDAAKPLSHFSSPFVTFHQPRNFRISRPPPRGLVGARLGNDVLESGCKGHWQFFKSQHHQIYNPRTRPNRT